MILSKFNDILNGTQRESYEKYIDSGPAQIINESIVVTPFWKPDFCKYLIDYVETVGSFAPLPGDLTKYGAAPGQECRISTVSELLYDLYRQHILKYHAPFLSKFYRCGALFQRDFNVFRDPFIVRYTMDTQRTMDEHTDLSLLSLSIHLNKDFEGCSVNFPRQGWNNAEVPLGYATWFPGQLTHPHFTSELKSGKRYGLTGWIRGPNLRDAEP